MASQKTLLFSLGLASALCLGGCAAKKSDSSSPGCANIDFSKYTSGGPTVSLMTDVMPIFAFKCNASSCHNESKSEAGLNLGGTCIYSEATQKCTFPLNGPDASDMRINPPVPLTPDTVKAVYDNIVGFPSKTAPAMMRVKAGDPENSFLVLKISGQQNAKGLTCKNQDPTAAGETTPPKPCGEYMPVTGDPVCLDSPADFDTIARWVGQGAVNDDPGASTTGPTVGADN